MRPTSLSVAITFATLACSVSAATSPRFDLFNVLPDCWEDCLEHTENGCNSSKCICEASQSNTYLPPAVSCITKNCKDRQGIDLRLLFPVQAYCNVAGDPIPDDVIKSAYAATAKKTSTAAPSSTRKVEDTPKSSGNPKATTKQGDPLLTRVYTTTYTSTITDKDGNTLRVEVPFFIGPSSHGTGEPFTITLDKDVSSSSNSASPSSAVASSSSSPETSAPAPSNTQQQQAASSTATARPTQRLLNSNGSPFEDTKKAAASRWHISGPALGLGVVSGLLFMLH